MSDTKEQSLLVKFGFVPSVLSLTWPLALVGGAVLFVKDISPSAIFPVILTGLLLSLLGIGWGMYRMMYITDVISADVSEGTSDNNL